MYMLLTDEQYANMVAAGADIELESDGDEIESNRRQHHGPKKKRYLLKGDCPNRIVGVGCAQYTQSERYCGNDNSHGGVQPGSPICTNCRRGDGMGGVKPREYFRK